MFCNMYQTQKKKHIKCYHKKPFKQCLIDLTFLFYELCTWKMNEDTNERATIYNLCHSFKLQAGEAICSVIMALTESISEQSKNITPATASGGDNLPKASWASLKNWDKKDSVSVNYVHL